MRRRRTVPARTDGPPEQLVPLDGRRSTLAAHEVRVAVGGEDVLHDVSLSVRPGEMLALTGPSGAGKSTLLWALCGAQPIRAGSVDLDGEPITDHDQACGAGVVLLPQGSGLAALLTAHENVFLPMTFHGVPFDLAQRRADSALAAVGLGELGDRLIEELSGGQQQRVGVARLLAGSASVLLADEPTSELDAGNRTVVLDLLRRYADAGVPVVFATHDPEAAAIADGELVLREGRPEWARSLRDREVAAG